MPKQLAELQKDWEQFTRTRNEVAYQKLYKHYYQYLSFIGLKRGCATTQVKDAINELFLHLWERGSNLAHVKNYHSYFTTIFLNAIHKKENFSTDVALEADAIEDSFNEPSVEAAYIQGEVREALQALVANYLQGLPTRQREVIYQKFYLGLSYAEIAAANQLSVNTVYNTVYQALEKLKGLLDGQNVDLLGLSLLGLLWGMASL
ncbi:MAG: sigma-70 family RNA polymerase sigma factor [Hymenobacter sp.]|nr:MAG: sigma-70 family RNA polymerase sigma factor [Hymenobacter sp.]